MVLYTASVDRVLNLLFKFKVVVLNYYKGIRTVRVVLCREVVEVEQNPFYLKGSSTPWT